MSKPLELAAFTREPGRYGREPRYNSPDGFWSYPVSHVDELSARKRLTDAEMCAELFRQTAWLGANGRAYRADAGRNIILEPAFTFGPITRDEHEWLTLSSFTTRPHYDQEPTAP